MQRIAEWRSELALPTISEERRARLERDVQEYEDYIQDLKESVAKHEEEMERATAALQQLGESVILPLTIGPCNPLEPLETAHY